jgi:3-hydroxyacyl-CoA dehydrogenase
MNEIVSWQVHGSIGLLTFDNPPVNAISASVRAALVKGIARAGLDPDVSAIVIACAGKTFFAGADLKEFGKPSVPPFLTEVVDAIEASAKPVVAAIHGTALGGGLEIAMACHYRVALPSARLGLPEVKLALMPGARGTQYLPRLVGIEHALNMIALGDPATAAAAKDIGLVDELSDSDLLDCAVAFARRVAGSPPRRTRDLIVPPVADAVYDAFAAKHARKFRGFDAPPAIIASIRAATELPFEEGAKRERDIFLKLREGPQNEAMRHVFFAEREAAKVPGLEAVTPRMIATTGVIGAGTMGSGIAIALLSAGLPVTIFERDGQALDRGVERIRTTLEGNVRAGRLKREQADAALASLQPVLVVDSLAGCDLVIEAAYETMEVKQAIFTDLDRVMNAGAILATNTSYLDVDAIAAVTSRPQNVVGLHFFSPANIMKLLEIVRGKATAPDVLATALNLAKRIGKIPVVSGNAYGFIGNRMLAVRRREAEAMVVEGALPWQVDRVLEEFGFPMGPFRMADLAGLDLGWSAESSSGSTIRERLCEAGRRGQKTKAGFYDYDEANQPKVSELVEEIIAGFASDNGISRRTLDDTEILDRLLWPMVDEGAQLLDEGIAQRASDIDTVWLNGYGWPQWTGGPMFHAKQTGLTEVCRRLRSLGKTPSDALQRL